MTNAIITSQIFYDDVYVLRAIDFVNRMAKYYPDNDSILQLLRDYQFHIVVADMYERARDECEDTDIKRMLHRKNISHLDNANSILRELFQVLSSIN